MNVFIVLAFLFFIGSIIGWVIELLFRRFFSAKKWINPGFLVGPYLPLYGLGVMGLFLISSLNFSFIGNDTLETILILIIMAIIMTFIEYLTGLFFLKVMNIRLWDYSDRLLNIQGLICPLFSMFWAIIGCIYYFFINPYIINALTWLSNNLAFSFVIGFFYGVLMIDVGYSFHLATKIKSFAKEHEIVVKYEKLKENVRNYIDEAKEKVHFFQPFKTAGTLKETLLRYKDKIFKEKR